MNNDDDGISMYLSFDNTTNSDSTSTYKTIACDEMTSFSDLIGTEDSKGNTTLHNSNKIEDLSGMMKDCISVGTDVAAKSLLRPHVLREFNVVSSTPSKIDIFRKSLGNFGKEDNSNMKDCISVATDIISQGQPFANAHVLNDFNAVSSTPSKIMTPRVTGHTSPAKELFEFNRKSLVSGRGSADLSAVFNSLVSEYEQENKENPQRSLPTSSDDSMPSFSQSSILQLEKFKKLLPPPPPPPPPPSKHQLSPKSMEIEGIVKSLKECEISAQNKRRQSSPHKAFAISQTKECNKLPPIPSRKHIESVLDSIEVYNILANGEMEVRRSKAGMKSALESIKECTANEPTKTVLKVTGDKKVKMNFAVRKTICEPNLLTNLPSRIITGKKTRFSMAINDQNIGDSASRQAPAPPLLSRKASTSSISDSSVTLIPTNTKQFKPRYASDEECNQASAPLARRSMVTAKTTGAGRRSMAAHLQNEKRPTPRRMPPIAKTTLNFAIRKSSRPSLSANGNVAAKRRSVLLLQTKSTSSPRRRKLPPTSSEVSSERFSPTRRNVIARKSFCPQDKTDAHKYICAECNASFFMKSSWEAHKKTHRAPSPDLTKKLPRALGGSATINGCMAASNTANHQCKYCDKNFVLERALHIHLMEHCPKIPATERRKLNFPEMNHVRKEEIPHFRAPARTLSKPPPNLSPKDALSHLPARRRTEVPRAQIDSRIMAGNDKKSYNEIKHNARNNSPSKQAANKQAQMAPPHSTKIKKRYAHSGVYRTPNKDIPCVACKQSFKSVLDYTNHMMATHAALDASLSSLGGNIEFSSARKQ